MIVPGNLLFILSNIPSKTSLKAILYALHFVDKSDVFFKMYVDVIDAKLQNWTKKTCKYSSH